VENGSRWQRPKRARVNIDRLLEQAGWSVQDLAAVDIRASRGVA
jgi:hypothetical protein